MPRDSNQDVFTPPIKARLIRLSGLRTFLCLDYPHSYCLLRQLARALEDLEEHGGGEFAGVGVLQRGMVGGEEPTAAGQLEFGSVAEMIVAPPFYLIGSKKVGD